MLARHHRLIADVAERRIPACPCELGARGAVPMIHAPMTPRTECEVVGHINAVPSVADRAVAKIRLRRSRIQGRLEPGCGSAPLAGPTQPLARLPVDAVVRHMHIIAWNAEWFQSSTAAPLLMWAVRPKGRRPLRIASA